MMKSAAIPQSKVHSFTKPNLIKRNIFKLDQLFTDYTTYLLEAGKEKFEVQQNIMTISHFAQWYEVNYQLDFIFDKVTMIELFSYLEQLKSNSNVKRIVHLKDFWNFLYTKKEYGLS